MVSSRNIFNTLVHTLASGMLFCAAAQSQDATIVADSARPSSQVAMLTESPILAAGSGAPLPFEVATTEPQPSSEEIAASAGSQPASSSAALVSQAATQSSPSGGSVASSVDETSDNQFHYYGTLYLWIPQINGTVGLRGYDTNIHVSSGDIFSNFRGGFLGVFTPTYNRFSAPVDVLWMRLRASQPVPSEVYPGYSVRATMNMSIVTPKAAYLMVNNPKIKIYGNMGARVWHVGTTLSLVPVLTGTFPYRGVTWTDFVMGGRFSVPVGAKASVDVLGDAGKGGATLDYQVAGLLSYQAKPNLTLQGGWRYLAAHYGNNGNIFNGRIQGIVIGATFKLK